MEAVGKEAKVIGHMRQPGVPIHDKDQLSARKQRAWNSALIIMNAVWDCLFSHPLIDSPTLRVFEIGAKVYEKSGLWQRRKRPEPCVMPYAFLLWLGIIALEVSAVDRGLVNVL
jgi:hypothetical protein